MTIPNKVLDVPDEVCRGEPDGVPCNQLWKGECRAYQMPHSKEEQTARYSPPRILRCWNYVHPPQKTE